MILVLMYFWGEEGPSRSWIKCEKDRKESPLNKDFVPVKCECEM